MKYLVLLAVLVVVYTLWKNQRVRERAEREGSQPRENEGRQDPARGTQEMIRCPVCDVHLPRADAVADAQGRLFCSAAHRDKANS